jgi:hypothetical protein
MSKLIVIRIKVKEVGPFVQKRERRFQLVQGTNRIVDVVRDRQSI